MLKIFRKKGVAKKVLWFVAGLIILSFGFGFGISRLDGLTVNTAAGKVFGEDVSIRDFQRYMADRRDQIFLSYGENSRKILPYMNMEEETWSRIILLKEADKRHVTVADPEVVMALQNIPLFQINGQFDRKRYEQVVRSFSGRDPRAFEEGVRDQIKIMKMLRRETMKLRLSDEEIRQAYERRHQKVQVSYVLLDPKKFTSDITVSEDELAAYYDKNRQDLLEPDAVNVERISVPLAPDATDEQKKDARKKARDIRDKLTAGEDPAEVAKANGLTAETTGFFNMEEPRLDLRWPLELLQKVFDAKTGDVIGPEETLAGLQVLKLLDRRPAYIPEFAAVKDEIKTRIVAEKTAAMAASKAEEDHAKIAEKTGNGASFETAVKSRGLDIKTTPFFLMEDYIPEIGLSEDFKSAAFALNADNRLSNVVTTAKGPTILYWQAIEPIDEAKFEADKKTFTETLYQEEETRLLSRVIQEIKDKAQLESYLDKLRKKNN